MNAAADNSNPLPLIAYFSGVVHATLNVNHQIYISKEFEFELELEQGKSEAYSMFAFLPPQSDIAFLYTRNAWQRYRSAFIERQSADSDNDDALTQRAIQRIDTCAVPVLLDSTGRFTVRKSIREHLGLTGRSDRQIALVGNGRVIRLMTPKTYDERIARKDDELDALITDSLPFFGDGYAIDSERH
ncbi:MAG: hypothetical protein ABIH86_01255 [Planctomycetota bacterium]